MSDQLQGSAAPEAAPTSEPTESESQTQEEQGQEAKTVADIDADKSLSKTEKKEAKKELKKLKLKVDGKEIEEEFDPSDDEYLTRQLQLAKMGQKRAQEYSSLEKEVKQFIEDLRKNPRKVLQDPNIGIDVKQLAAQIIEEEIENSKKSPEQLAKEQLEKELKSLKDEREKEKETFKKQELERLQQQEYERYDMLMTQALEKSDLPKSPYTVKKIAEYMIMGLNEGIDITPQDVLPLVKDEMQNDLKEMFAVMPEDVIEQLIGKDVIGRIRKKNLARAKEAPQTAKSIKDTGKLTEAKESNDGPKQSFKDFFKI